MTTALEICQRNTEGARAKKEQMRRDFPLCAAFIDSLLKEGFRPRVIRMEEEGRQWSR